MNRKWLSTLFFFFALVGWTSLAVASPGPTEALKPILTDIMLILNDASLAGNDHKPVRRAKIMNVVEQGFDFQEMSKRVLGRTWKKIDDHQREHFVGLFTKFLENVYIGKLEGYSGQEIVYNDERIKGKRAAVSTVVQNQGLLVPVNYIMIKKDASWQVYDINIEGVSLLRNYREQFKSILRKKKFEGLVKVLEEKNASFDTEGS